MPEPKPVRQKKRREVDVGQSLAQLHHLRPPFSVGPDGQSPSFRSGLIDRCERLLVTPLREFEPGDLRVMLGQQFYPETLVPLALPSLEADPLMDAELYPGDLLSAALHQTEAFWNTAPDLLARVQVVAERALANADLFEPVRKEIEDFKARTNSPSGSVLK